jgi:hypothetical protein
MSRFVIAFTLLVFGSLGFVKAQKANAEETYTPGQNANKTFNDFVQVFLNDYCLDCHDNESLKGDLSLEELGPVDETNADTWKALWAQVTLKEMPPKKKRNQPQVIERLQFSDWIVGEMQRVMQDNGRFQAHLDPSKGNFVDHDLLFGSLPESIELAPTSSSARLWRVTPEEHITRLNALINREPEFDPTKPGLRTKGDVVPTNHGGELKLYFGTDRIVKWTGGTVAYATAVKAVPAVLSSSRVHGLDKYPDFYTVNSAEATQIMGLAEDLIRYMADGPLSIAEPWQITDNGKAYDNAKPGGDIRGLPISIMYSTKVMRPLTPVRDLMQAEADVDKFSRAAVEYLFEALTFRPPSKTESDAYLAIVRQSIEKLGKKDGAVLGLSSIFLDRDALFRPELVENGEPDAYGRFMLQDWELGLALNHALRYIKPDELLRKAIVEGRLHDKEDVRREVERMLADDRIRKPRLLRFFREYFDYDRGGYICKDTKALADTGAGVAGAGHYRAMFDATASTDRLIELILQEDKDVLNQLLTTDKVVATKRDNIYFGMRRTEPEIATSEAAAKEAEKKQKREEAESLELAGKEVADLEIMLDASPGDRSVQRALTSKKRALASAKRQVTEAKKKRNSMNHKVTVAELAGPKIFARVSRRSFGNGTLKPDRFLATAPEGQRLGILTHPSWLISHSDAMDNHAIHRGRWIRERLLGGGIPDVPITVDAMLPDEPDHTLRERMRVTREDYCWTCHEKMDPLGLPFEMYNHAGLYRETELGKPVDTAGEITDSGDPTLDGEVTNAIDMIQKLSKSVRVEQVFVRHAFRFWMGRNETINDGPILQEAYHAYKDSGGSMKALLVSLLTSDAFLYRTK